MSTLDNVASSWIEAVYSQSAPFADLSTNTGYANAYQYANNTVNFGNPIRGMYTTSNSSTLDNLAEALERLPIVADPNGAYTADDLNYVINTCLIPELSAAEEVSGFFLTYQTYFFSPVFTVNESAFNEIVDALALAEINTSVNVSAFDIFAGVSETLVGTFGGPAGSILAGLTATAISAEESGLPTSSLPDSYSVLIDQLESSLTASIMAAENNLGAELDKINSDWGMMQAMVELLRDELNISISEWNDAATSGEAAFITSMIQILLPAKYVVWKAYAKTNVIANITKVAYMDGYNVPHSSSSGIDPDTESLTFPSNSITYCIADNTMTGFSGYSDYTWAIYWIAETANSADFLLPASNSLLEQYVNNNPQAFLSQNYWAAPIAPPFYANGVFVRIVNQSEFPLTATMSEFYMVYVVEDPDSGSGFYVEHAGNGLHLMTTSNAQYDVPAFQQGTQSAGLSSTVDFLFGNQTLAPIPGVYLTLTRTDNNTQVVIRIEVTHNSTEANTMIVALGAGANPSGGAASASLTYQNLNYTCTTYIPDNNSDGEGVLVVIQDVLPNI